MPLVSVTRFRARSIRFLPLFAFHASRTIARTRKADGDLAGAIKRDAGFALWTMTVLRDKSAMRLYRQWRYGKTMPLFVTGA